MASHVSAVLFAKDAASLTRFYQETLGLTLTRQQDTHPVLSCPGLRVVVHQIPRAIADGITIERPPRRRELRRGIRGSFPVESLGARAFRCGDAWHLGDPATTEWSDDGAATCMGHDPEGNVFQVSGRSS